MNRALVTVHARAVLPRALRKTIRISYAPVCTETPMSGNTGAAIAACTCPGNGTKERSNMRGSLKEGRRINRE